MTLLYTAAATVLSAMCAFVDEVKGDRSQQQKLLQQFADAVRARDAHALSAYMSAATLGSGVQQVLASRVIAGVWDANTYLLHDMATKLVVSAQTSR
jgi:formate-dependent nitrite reductase membrane component NrfD